MSTELIEPATLENLAESLARLRAELVRVQDEWAHAVDAGQSLLADEQKEFQALLASQRKISEDQEMEWQTQRAAYEQKIQELETFFKTQLHTTEQNALRTLNELDDSWQREKITWQRTSSQTALDLQDREAAWGAEAQKQAERFRELEQETLQLQARLSESDADHTVLRDYADALKTALEAQTIESEREKTLWQSREEYWAAEWRKQAERMKTFQDEIAQLQTRLQTTGSPDPVPQNPATDLYMNTLEQQISALGEFVHHLIPAAAPPARRKSDTASVARTLLNGGQ